MIKYYLFAFLAVIVTVIAQIFLKKGANLGKVKQGVLSIFLNVYSITGYVLFILVTLLSLYALQKIELKEMVFIIPMSYLLIPIVSKVYLNEKISKKRWTGTAVIFLGIIIFNLEKLFS